MKKTNKNKRRAFTLIELLVVVLIIGILAAVALPQYQRSVKRAKMAEMNIFLKSLTDSIDRYRMASGAPFPVSMLGKELADGLDIELSGGTWDTDSIRYKTKNFIYGITAGGDSYLIEITLPQETPDFYLQWSGGYVSGSPVKIEKTC